MKQKNLIFVGRVFGGLVCFLFLLPFILGGLNEGPTPSTEDLWEVIPMVILIIIVTILYGIAGFGRNISTHRKLHAGYAILLIAISMGFYIPLFRGWEWRFISASLMHALPFSIVGLLFIIYYKKEE